MQDSHKYIQEDKVWLVGSNEMSSLYFDQVGLSTLFVR